MDRIARRGWLLGLAALVALPAGAAGPRRRRRQARKPEVAAAPPPPPPPPQIDGPPPPSRIPGLEPAPVPDTGSRPPLADRQPRMRLQLGMPNPPAPFQGQTFSNTDPSPDRRPPAGSWLPSSGASVRLPF